MRPGALDAQELGNVHDREPALETLRKPSTMSGGRRERLASVFLRTRWPSRQAWRSRTAGLLAWLGIVSIWKDTGECYGNNIPVEGPLGWEEPAKNQWIRANRRL